MAVNRLRAAGPHLLRSLQAFSSKIWFGTALGALVVSGGGCNYDFSVDTPCGDGVVQGDEACDDGDLVPGDGCDETCHIEEGWSCLGEPSQCDTICGDGRVLGDEVCDDGNKQDGDGCSSDCRSLEQCGDGKINQGEGCDDGANGDPCDGCLDNCMVHSNVCGDGYVCGDEECDDGNSDNTDACLNNCTPAWCGDGYVRSGQEECDDGNGVNTDACLNTCVAASCGDGVVWFGVEECDDANTDDTDACLNTCVAASCGDGVIWDGQEECDDGNEINTDACLDTCLPASCGDGAVWAGHEECDDGDADDTDACLSTCVAARCGDGIVWAGHEDCDDGNGDNTDACPDDGANGGTCLAAYCGDGHVWSGNESCDDGNIQLKDGCDHLCEVEDNWVCTGSPSECEWLSFGWVTLTAGTFNMGSPNGELGREITETRHSVTLTHDFEIYASVVTQYEFELLMNQNPSNNSACGGGCPVESVTWHQAALYCNFLSLNLGYDTCYTCSGVWPNISCDLDTGYTSPYECPGYRLPTEAEWEYAARAGTTAATYNGNFQAGKLGCEPPNDTLDPIAWFCGNCGNTLQRVGLKDPNPWDLYDMLGGVWEWCHDWYENYPSTAVEDPWGSTPSSGRMVRGGSWYNPAGNARAAQRLPVEPSSVFINVGIRPVRTLNP